MSLVEVHRRHCRVLMEAGIRRKCGSCTNHGTSTKRAPSPFLTPNPILTTCNRRSTFPTECDSIFEHMRRLSVLKGEMKPNRFLPAFAFAWRSQADQGQQPRAAFHNAPCSSCNQSPAFEPRTNFPQEFFPQGFQPNAFELQWSMEWPVHVHNRSSSNSNVWTSDWRTSRLAVST